MSSGPFASSSMATFSVVAAMASATPGRLAQELEAFPHGRETTVITARMGGSLADLAILPNKGDWDVWVF
jgi:hypothetical protein